jgi:hypothetical protein
VDAPIDGEKHQCRLDVLCSDTEELTDAPALQNEGKDDRKARGGRHGCYHSKSKNERRALLLLEVDLQKEAPNRQIRKSIK